MCALVAVALLACVVDVVMNWDRAYGNISINGVNVGGMNSAEMHQVLQEDVGTPLSHAQVSIYADEEARQRMLAAMAAAEEVAQGSQEFVESEQVEVDYWITDAHTLKATFDYDAAVRQALDVGRSDGGIIRRMALTFQPAEIELELSIDEREVENLAAQIDQAIGTPRRDTTVQINRAWATVVEGSSGVLVDRAWFTEKLLEALSSENLSSSFLAELRDAPSRISLAQAETLCDQLNHALGCDAVFVYKDNRFAASDIDLGDWTRVDVVPASEAVGGGAGAGAGAGEDAESADETAETSSPASSLSTGYALKPSIDASRAISPIVNGADARVTSEDTHAAFERSDAGISVGLSGTGYMPEVSAAVDALDKELYGPEGYAYTTKAPTTIEIEIGETDRPDSLALDQALSLGLVCVVGEYTTEFSNYVGTENRNHNIKLAADILNNGIIKANGGIWSFNDESGNTNEEAGFWSAGSIVNGVITDSIGGGICQVATTIFNAVYEAGLKVPERHNHTIYMANYPDGRDAAVSYPDIDLVWRNDLTSDILLTLSYTDTSITCSLYSVYTGYSAQTFPGEWQEGEKFSLRFEEDASLAKDTYRLKSEGKDGSRITIERVVHDSDGKVVFNDSFGSIYDPEDETYTVGPGTDTKKLEKELQEKKEAEKKAEEEAEAAKAQAEAEAAAAAGEAETSADAGDGSAAEAGVAA